MPMPTMTGGFAAVIMSMLPEHVISTLRVRDAQNDGPDKCSFGVGRNPYSRRVYISREGSAFRVRADKVSATRMEIYRDEIVPANRISALLLDILDNARTGQE
jgi:hypothetical protein